MLNYNLAPVRSAGAYITYQGTYPFAIGLELHDENIPVYRLGGHVQEGESGWECAAREAAEEASISISPVAHNKTYLADASHWEASLRETAWNCLYPGDPDPVLVVAYELENGPVLSLMYLARTEDLPMPSSEVKGILLLREDDVFQICRTPTTLEQYLQSGGRALLQADFDRSLVLEPFMQLRILARLLRERLI